MMTLMSRVPESCGPSTTAFVDHVRYLLRHRERLLEFFGSKRHRQQRWGVYIRKQQAVEHMCAKVTGGRSREEVVVAFGAARGPHMKGTLPAPVKLLHKALQGRAVVQSVDEFRTSIVCSKCNHQDMVGVKCSKAMSERLFRARRRSSSQQFSLYDVRACQYPSCRTVWNRNVNAARNILEVYLSLLATGRRPVGFRRR